MRIPHAALPVIRLVVLTLFIVGCAGAFGYLWVNSGGKLPVVTQRGYQVSMNFPSVSNLVYDSDVMMAGVKIGKVDQIEAQGNHAHVVVQLDSNFPLHQGASITARQKTLIEETYLDIADGPGAPMADGSNLPDSAAKPAVELNDVLTSLDAPTRQALSGTIQSLGTGTEGRHDDISATLQGLGDLGRNGHTVLDAVSAQSQDLQHLTGATATLLTALDTRQGQIAQLVTDADTLTNATAGDAADLQSVMRQLPGLLDSTRNASGELTNLSVALQPVAANLKTAAPQLDTALQQLPATASDLRGLLPSLNGVLDRAPDTLRRVPIVSTDLDQTVASANVALGDVNPMLAYIQPYGHDVAAFFTNFAQALNRGDINGKTLRIFMVYNEQAVKGLPINTNVGPLNKSNAYPPAGGSANPGPFTGTYPRVRKDPVK